VFFETIKTLNGKKTKMKRGEMDETWGKEHRIKMECSH